MATWKFRLFAAFTTLMVAAVYLVHDWHRDDSTGKKGAPSVERFTWSEQIQDWVLCEENCATGKPPRVASRCIWPEQRGALCSRDRIVEQLQMNKQTDREFKIAIAGDRNPPGGRQPFLEQNCLVNRCAVTQDFQEADAIIYPNSDAGPNGPEQDKVSIAYLLESPENTFDRRFKRLNRGNGHFNWTATYRSDSTIVTPYSKFVVYSHKVNDYLRLKENLHSEAPRMLPSTEQEIAVRNKTAMVAWFVSNCHAKNNRLEYARELSRHIQVDVYGKCGSLQCAKQRKAECEQLLYSKYKFYLSFENTNSREYITEKLFDIGLGRNDANKLLVPIVMGARREDYETQVPPGSFIHVDDFESPAELARHLKFLDRNAEEYLRHFQWKTMGRFIDTKFLCRVCALLHESHSEPPISRSMPDVSGWWLGE